AATYKIDPAHSHIGFSVKHLVISNVKGNFKKLNGGFDLDPENNISSATLEVDAASINTENEKRDKHLRSSDFLDVSLHPKIVFQFKKTVSRSDNKYKVLGDITIRGVTKDIELEGELLGKVKDPWGYERAGFTGTGKLDRTEFGLVWNNVLETGGVVVGNSVTLLLEFEGILQK
ncbi:MAG: YceI family protein, partial [Nitrospinota bacterium]